MKLLAISVSFLDLVFEDNFATISFFVFHDMDMDMDNGQPEPTKLDGYEIISHFPMPKSCCP